MSNTLKCTSTYNYRFNGGSQKGTGNTQAAAEKNAVAQFANDAITNAENNAISDAKTNNCESDCLRSISTGKPVFETTQVSSGAAPISVTVTLFVPITVSCIKRKVSPPVAVRTEGTELTDQLTGTPVRDVGTEVGRMNLVVSALPQSE